MNTRTTFFLIFTTVVSTLLSAAEAPKELLHWYQITILAGDSSAEFTGSSSLDATQFSARLAGGDPIVLENLRIFATDSTSPTAKWRPIPPGGKNPNTAKKVVINPRFVLYFYEFDGDPSQILQSPHS
jgi:hypothetical protein